MSSAKPLSVDTVPIAEGLDEAGGWIGMDVQFLVDHATGAESMVFGRTLFRPGHGLHARHRHSGAEEVVLIVRGHGIAFNGDDEVEVGPGDVVFHPRNEWHGFKNLSETEDVEMLWVWGGAASRSSAGYEQSST
ncbi:MAG: cupin domain-containing protein [Acidimicrobiales bacterium]